MGSKVAMVLHPPKLRPVLLVGASFSWLGCSSSSGQGLECGTGTTQTGKDCVVLALDASLDAISSTLGDAGTQDAAATGPKFGGVTAVAPASASALFVAWNAGSDPTSPTTPPRYRVYVGPSSRPLAYETPAVLTEPGAPGAVVGGLMSTEYVVGVRAVNAAGVDDGNMVQLRGTPSADVAPPTFPGLKTAKTGGGGAVSLSWDAAIDNLTPAAAMTYLVYMSSAAGAEDFTSPALVSGPGATTATVGHLPNATQARYFVVRARDAAGNVDANTVELSATPGIDVTPPRVCRVRCSLESASHRRRGRVVPGDRRRIHAGGHFVRRLFVPEFGHVRFHAAVCHCQGREPGHDRVPAAVDEVLLRRLPRRRTKPETRTRTRSK